MRVGEQRNRHNQNRGRGDEHGAHANAPRYRTIPMCESVKLHVRDDLKRSCFVTDARKLTDR
jgi:hypothetical protein